VVAGAESVTADLAFKRIRRATCEIIQGRGVIFDAPFAAYNTVYGIRSAEKSEARVEERVAKAGRKLRQHQEMLAQGLT
jgi:hypothetical protein